MTHYSPFVRMADVHQPGQSGNVRLERFIVTPVDAERSQMRFVVTQGRERPVRAGDYVRLMVGKSVMMSDTQMEQDSNREVVRQARGQVLIAGLGLGLILLPIMAKEDVTSVTVVELNQDVINLVIPGLLTHPGADKIRIIQADIKEFKPARGQRWDTIYFDIWPFTNSDVLEEMDELHKHFRRYRAVGGWMDSWERRTLLRRYR